MSQEFPIFQQKQVKKVVTDIFIKIFIFYYLTTMKHCKIQITRRRRRKYSKCDKWDFQNVSKVLSKFFFHFKIDDESKTFKFTLSHKNTAFKVVVDKFNCTPVPLLIFVKHFSLFKQNILCVSRIVAFIVKNVNMIILFACLVGWLNSSFLSVNTGMGWQEYRYQYTFLCKAGL